MPPADHVVASDPFEVLGLDTDAGVEEVRARRRLLARRHHPDRGGDAARMRTINEAADAVLAALDRAPASVEDAPPDPSEDAPSAAPGAPADVDARTGNVDDARRVARDAPSFTVEALPVETFEAMLVVASWLGEVLDDDPPSRLDTYLASPFDCWCRLEVVADAGASTVSLTVAGIDGAPAPELVAVRDAWVEALNTVDWP